MKGFHFPSTRTTNSVRLILGTQYSLCENYIKRARLHWGLKQVLGTNLIPLRTKFDTQTKRVPAWPVINQLWFPERHFSANGISLRLGEVQMKIWKGWLQALLSPAHRGSAARFARPNRRACSQASGNTIRLLSIWSIFTLRPLFTKLFFTLIQLFFRTQLTHPKHCISWQLFFNAFVVIMNKSALISPPVVDILFPGTSTLILRQDKQLSITL